MMSDKTKDIRIAIPCPWGPTLRFIELKEWVDCDVHQWLSMTHLVVRTSKEGFKKATLGGCIFYKKGENLCLKVEKI